MDKITPTTTKQTKKPNPKQKPAKKKKPLKKPKQAKPLSKIPNTHENMHMGYTGFSFGPLQYKEGVRKIVWDQQWTMKLRAGTFLWGVVEAMGLV